MKSDEVYLRHVLDAIARIEGYTAEAGEAAFFTEPMRQDAVARQLEVIGEACRQLSEPAREAHPEVPWWAIIGLRNRIAHDSSTWTCRCSGKSYGMTCRCCAVRSNRC